MRKVYLQGIMEKPLNRLTDKDIQIAVNEDAKMHAPKTIRNMVGLLSAALKGEKEFTVDLPPKERTRIVIPTEDEINQIFSYIEGKEIELPVILVACLGLRRGEIVPLEYSDVNYENKTLTVSKSMVLNSNSEWITKAPKTYTSNRTLKVYDFILHKIKFRQDAELPFISLNPNQITGVFSDTLRVLDICHFRFHDLRHYNASVMLTLTIPDKYTMERMGHATNNVLKTVYQHTMQEKEDSVDNSLNDYFSTAYNKK